MILFFPGTRGEIEEKSKHHRYHSSLVIEESKTKILIDYGYEHNPALEKAMLEFDALLITHAHPDHYIWTKKANQAIKIPVYLTRETLQYSKNRPSRYRIIEPGDEFKIKDVKVIAYPVIHSIRCPAVCFKIGGEKSLVYAPDLVDTVADKSIVFDGIDVLIADSSSLNINMVRRIGDQFFGHTRVKTIINWCKKYGIDKLILTHLGKQVVTMDKPELEEKINQYAGSQVEVEVAYDGWEKKI